MELRERGSQGRVLNQYLQSFRHKSEIMSVVYKKERRQIEIMSRV